MTQPSHVRGSPPFNDYIVPAILLLIASICLLKSIVVIKGDIGINGNWAMSSLAFVACALLSRINTHLRFLVWLSGGQNAIDVWHKAGQGLENLLDHKLDSVKEDFLEAQQERTARQKRMEEQRQHEQEQRQQEEALKKARAIKAAQALAQDDSLTPEDEAVLQNTPAPNTPDDTDYPTTPRPNA